MKRILRTGSGVQVSTGKNSTMSKKRLTGFLDFGKDKSSACSILLLPSHTDGAGDRRMATASTLEKEE